MPGSIFKTMQIVFRRESQNPKLAVEIMNQEKEYLHCISSLKVPIYKRVMRIYWEHPPEGWTKLNTNGSSIGRMSVAGCGGVARDDHGVWVASFSRRIGLTNNIVANQWD